VRGLAFLQNRKVIRQRSLYSMGLDDSRQLREDCFVSLSQPHKDLRACELRQTSKRSRFSESPMTVPLFWNRDLADRKPDFR